jgi:AraC-like DNA-binding protein
MNYRINYQYFVMMLPLSEPVPLIPGAPVRLERVSREPDKPVPERFPHFHGPAELVLVAQGRGTFLCEDRAFDFAGGMILYAPSMAVHDFAFDAGPLTWTLIQFDPHALQSSGVTLPPTPRALTPDPDTAARIAMLADWLAQSIAAGAAPRHQVLQLQALMLALGEAPGRTGLDTATTPASLARFRPLLDRIDHQPGQALSLAQAASLCAMSPAYFSRVFTRTFGTGFSAYQTRLKLQQAARHLATGDEPVAQIAWRTGFRSHAYFSQCFRDLFGTTPSHYRQRGQAQT